MNACGDALSSSVGCERRGMKGFMCGIWGRGVCYDRCGMTSVVCCKEVCFTVV